MIPYKLPPEQLQEIILGIMANRSSIPEILSEISSAGLQKMLSQCEEVLSKKTTEFESFDLIDLASLAKEIRKILASRDLESSTL